MKSKFTLLSIVFFSCFFVKASAGALSPLDSLKTVWKHAGKIENRLDACKKIATYYLEHHADSALTYALAGQKKAYEHGLKEKEAYFQMYTGKAFLMVGDIYQAFQTLQNALTQAVQIQSLSLEAQIRYAISYTYLSENKREKALSEIQRVRDLAKRTQNQHLFISSTEQMAGVLSEIGEGEEAVAFFMEAIKLAEENKEYHVLSSAHHNLGVHYMDYGVHLDKALEHLDECRLYEEKVGDSISLIHTYLNMGITLSKLNKFPEALDFYGRSLEYARTTGTITSKNDILKEIAGLYEKQQDYKNAFRYYKMYKSASDSLFQKRKAKEYVSLEARYQLNERNRENKRLAADAQVEKQKFRFLLLLSCLLSAVLLLVVYLWKKLRTAKLEVEKQSAIKDRFFSIIAHDLRSPLVAFSTLPKQIRFFIKKGDIKKINRLSEQVEASTQTLSNLLDNLLNWSLSQQGFMPLNKQKLVLADLVGEAVSGFEGRAESLGISLLINIDGNHCIWADFNSLSTIIRNLVGNALKFTPKGGLIRIASSIRKDKHIVLMVSDTGCGIAPDKIKGLFELKGNRSKPGLRGEKGTGLGLVLCKEFADINNIRLSVESQLDKGTVFSLDMPALT